MIEITLELHLFRANGGRARQSTYPDGIKPPVKKSGPRDSPQERMSDKSAPILHCHAANMGESNSMRQAIQNELLDQRITVRFTATEVAQIRSAMKAEGLYTASGFVRRIIVLALQKKKAKN